MSGLIDMTGRKCGRWTVLYTVKRRNRWGGARWKCICDCGKTKIVEGSILRKGESSSCGCSRGDVVKYSSGYEANKISCYQSYQKSGRIRNIEFNLTIDQFHDITQKKCYYCGRKPFRNHLMGKQKRYTKEPYICNGIDRVNNDKGYVMGNLVTSCTDCNYMKAKMSQKKFLSLIARIAKTRIENDIFSID